MGKSGLKIGNNVLIGAGSKIITSSHNYHNADKAIYEQGMNFKEVEIENNVWLGFDVKILSGSKIKEGSIVGTNSVVNSQFQEKNILIGGTPAQKLKRIYE